MSDDSFIDDFLFFFSYLLKFVFFLSIIITILFLFKLIFPQPHHNVPNSNYFVCENFSVEITDNGTKLLKCYKCYTPENLNRKESSDDDDFFWFFIILMLVAFSIFPVLR